MENNDKDIDPNGPPKAIEEKDIAEWGRNSESGVAELLRLTGDVLGVVGIVGKHVIHFTGFVLAAAGTAFVSFALLSSATSFATYGATHSAKLKWQQREKEIRQAIEQEDQQDAVQKTTQPLIDTTKK